MKPHIRTTLLATIIVALDQITKYLAQAYLQPRHSITIIQGLFNLSYVENPGAAWGMLAGRQILLISFSILTLLFIIWKRRELFTPLPMGWLTFTLLVSGITGNLIDRIRLNRVIDFLDFHWQGSHFPAFNIADSAICCGVFLYLITQWLYDHKQKSLNRE